MLEAVACAHRHRIMHLHIKPQNFILVDDNRLRLADFGLARLARYSLSGWGSGTLEYIAPERAMGKPSYRSDLFSLGPIFYRMVSGHLPKWPFTWPPPGHYRVQRSLPAALVTLLEPCLAVDHERRFRDAVQALNVFRRAKPKAIKNASVERRRRLGRTDRGRELETMRFKLLEKRFGKRLEASFTRHRCAGPISEAMQTYPWCGAGRWIHRGGTRFPARCPRCRRGRKLDGRFCTWGFGPALKRVGNLPFSDTRHEARCLNPHFRELVLIPFTR